MGRKWIVGDRVWSPTGKPYQVVSDRFAIVLQIDDFDKESIVMGLQATLKRQGFKLAAI